MAKTTTKPTSKTETKAPKKAESTTPKKSKPAELFTADALETACEETLKKLQELGIEKGLQAELEWCLGSYRFDKNPAGLYETAERALVVLNAEKAKKTKGVTSKLIGDLEKAVKSK